MQYVYDFEGTDQRELVLPDADDEVLPGVRWGGVAEYFTPAFWKAYAWKQEAQYEPRPFACTLLEELAACMLCGYGVPSEIGAAAFRRLQERGLLLPPAAAELIQAALAEPLCVGGRFVRYRFHRSKGAAVAAAFNALGDMQIPGNDARAVRAALMMLPGVGPKTASYVVRNHFRSDDVAVLDVHITRASRMMGIFPPDVDPQRQYFVLEDVFLSFARAIGVRASVLDNLIWDGMRTLEPITRSA